jgi:hypothetical protein
VQYGQVRALQVFNHPTILEDIEMYRADGIAYGGTGVPAPYMSNVTFYNLLSSAYEPVTYGFNTASGARNTNTFTKNIGTSAIVSSVGHASGAGAYEIWMQRGGTTGAYKAGNWWEFGGGIKPGQIAFADISGATIDDGVAFFVTDGTAGSAPLTGSGTGCLAIKQNGVVNAVAVGSGAGGVSDGDKGDVTVSGGGATWTIDAGAVTLAKQADMATASVVYRKTAGAGAPEVQTLATLKTDLGLAGTNTGDQTSVSGNAGTATALATARNFSISGGGITAAAVGFDGTAAVALSASVDAGHITLARMADMATASVFYRKTAGSGAPEVQTLATLKTDLGLTGTNSGDQTITLTGDVTGGGTGSFAATLANNAVTLAKMATIATDSILGRATAATGNVEVLTALPFAYTGDVTRPADSNATTIANDAVTYAKMQNVSATDKVLGRSTAGSGDVEEIACTAAGRALIDDADAAAQRVTLGLSTVAIAFVIDGGGATITTGVKGDITIPFACTITEWTLMADQSGSIQIDIWKDTYANYPPTVADTITASAKPLISAATKGQSSTLTGWTTSVAAGDTLRFNVDSVTTCQRVTLSLKVTR